jgi:hypothetical protein
MWSARSKPSACVLDLRVESQTYPIAAAGLQADFARDEQVPYVDVVATQDPRMTFRLPARSYTVAHLAITAQA